MNIGSVDESKEEPNEVSIYQRKILKIGDENNEVKKQKEKLTKENEEIKKSNDSMKKQLELLDIIFIQKMLKVN